MSRKWGIDPTLAFRYPWKYQWNGAGMGFTETWLPMHIDGNQMVKLILLKGVRFIIVAMMLSGVLSFAHHSLAAHIPDIAIADGHVHDHGHDHDGEDDRSAGPTHSHNKGDHSHTVLIAITFPPGAPNVWRTGWHDDIPAALSSAPLYALERPPRAGFHA
ncbi:hypothetical protein [Niveispirillum lacus]|nr:hypothetical protein [Niveispirillum lacus]